MSDPHDEIKEDEDKFLDQVLLRQYQIEMIDIAKKQNSILFLPTGSGKTFIALQVLRSKFKELKQIPGNKSKVAVFLAPTKPLVKQLGDVVKEHTPLKVKHFVGEMGIDNWSTTKWGSELAGYQVYCMVPAIFLVLIRRNIIDLKDVAFLVLDECHRCVSNHPYVEIMREFDFIPKKEQQPLVLGLTATVLNGNPKFGQPEVIELQKNMRCTFAKTSRLIDAIKYGTSSVDKFIEYELDQMTDVYALILKILRDAYNLTMKLKLYDVLEMKAEKLMPQGCELLRNKNSITREIKNMFKHVENVVKELGLIAASFACLYYIIRLERVKLITEESVGVSATKYGITVLNVIRRIIGRSVPLCGPLDIRKLTSKKVNKLIDVLHEFENQDISCIILVEEKITAVILSSLLNRLSASTNKKFYQSNFVTGGLFNAVFDAEETIEENKRQKIVLERNFEFHILIATNVVEEGIDLPHCNVVVKFDPVKDYRSYIQSKGRPRLKNGDFFVFHTREELDDIKSMIAKFNGLHQHLLKELHSGGDESLSENDSITYDKENDGTKEDYFFAGGPNSSHVSATESITLIYRYCNRLPRDRYSSLAPLCWYDVHRRKAFLKFPSSCPVTHVIEGDPGLNRKPAKKNVFLKAVKVLFEAGEILDDLTFRSYKCNVEDHKDIFVKYRKEKRDPFTPKAGTKKRVRTYEIQNSINLSRCLPQSETLSYLHIIIISPKFERPESSRLGVFYDILSSPDTFAILSGKKASKICDFPLFLNIGTFNCSLIVNSAIVVLTSQDLERLQKFHFFLFHTLLGVVDRLQIFDNSSGDNSFFVVPVKHTDTKYIINWDVIDKTFRFTQELEELGDMIDPNPNIEDYALSVIYPRYRQGTYYIATSLDRSQTPMSKFPSENFNTYYDYYYTKYKVDILNKSQPLLEVKSIPSKINYLKIRIDKNQRKYEKEESFQEYLVPELCYRHLFSAPVWLKATVLPSALYRIMTITCIDDVRKIIATKINLGVIEVADDFAWLPLEVEKTKNDDEEIGTDCRWTSTAKKKLTIPNDETSEIHQPIDLFRNMDKCAPCDLNRYLRYFGLLPGETVEDTPISQENTNCQVSACKDIAVPVLPALKKNVSEIGPELRDFVKVFTCKSANDVVDLEKLEFFGDSILKFAASLYVFKRYKENEGILVGIKDKIVSNRNLFYCAEAKGFQNRLIVNEFEPKSEWCAPLFCLPLEIKELAAENTDSFEIDYNFEIPTKEKLAGKLSPETAETLQEMIRTNNKRSAYVVNELYFTRKKIPDKSLSDSVEALIGLYAVDSGLMGCFKIINWLNILPPSDGSYDELIAKPYTTDMTESPNDVLDQLHEVLVEDIENTIGYKFNNQLLLLEALTHPSFVGQGQCYQRLEFLGDSIIDVLISTYIYYHCASSSPGEMTDIRSAIVNNITLACITVKYNLHKYLLHHNLNLTSAITDFVNLQKEREYKIDSTVLVLREEDGVKIGESVVVPKAMGDLFESIVGAIFLDCQNSLETVWNILFKLMKDAIDAFSVNPPKSPIRLVYESFKPKPEFTYKMASDGSVLGSCKVIHNDKPIIFFGRGKNRQHAKLNAAKQALSFFDSAQEESS